MSDFYKLIQDEAKLDTFIDWLPDTDDNNQFYCCLFARKKWIKDDPSLSYDKSQLKRFTSTKDFLKAKIRQLECRVGAYTGKDNLPIPQEALGLYITPSPRDMRKATIRCIKKFAEKLEKNEYCNPRQEALNVIQTTSSKDSFHIFDIDTDDVRKLDLALGLVDNKASVIKTRGGFHLLLRTSDIDTFSKTWPTNFYKQLKNLSDVVGDCLTPIPGCCQGGYIPELTHIYK